MKYLIIDTSSRGTIVAVYEDYKPLKTLYDFDNTKQNERLPVMVRDVMQDLSLKIADLDKILVTKGPGSFTGIRIGLAFARGLALANNVEVIGIDNFDALKGCCAIDDEVLLAIDSKKGDWYMKVPGGDPIAGDIDVAKSLIAGMKSPKILGYHLGDLRKLTKYERAFEVEIAAMGIMNAYQSARKGADMSPTPLYIRQADVTVKK